MNNSREYRVATSVERATRKASADPLRPVYHFHPPSQWMNDPNGTVQVADEYHVFYQFNPFGDSWNHMHWGHAKTRDFLTWIHLPVALYPREEFPEQHCFSGCCALRQDGTPIIVYTSVPPDREKVPNTQRMAHGSADLSEWVQCREPVLELAEVPFSVENNWRDPYLFSSDGETFLVLGAKPVGAGSPPVVLLFRSADPSLTSWRYLSTLYTSSTEVTLLECPNFFALEGRWVLVVSPFQCVEYHTGSFDSSTGEFTAEAGGFVNYSSEYYATNTILDARNRLILFAWIRGFPKGRSWNGCHAIPRELHLDRDGRLLQNPIAETDDLRQEHGDISSDRLEAQAIFLTELPLWTMELQIDYSLHGDSSIRLELLAGTAEVLAIVSEREMLRVKGINIPVVSDEDSQTRTLRIYFDRSVMELFADDGRYCVSMVVEELTRCDGIRIERTEGAALQRIEHWRMGSLQYLRSVDC